MGNQEIRRSAEVSNRFLDKPTREMQRGPLGDASQVGQALLQLRRQIEDLDPSKGLGRPRRLFGMGNRMRDYFHKYQSAQTNIEAIIQGLYRGKDELLRDNASIEQEKVNLWAMKERLEQYIFMAERLDEQLSDKLVDLEVSDPEKARALKEDVLFYVRQKRQDLLTQMAVNVQGYLALELIRKNNQELVKGVDRAVTLAGDHVPHTAGGQLHGCLGHRDTGRRPRSGRTTGAASATSATSATSAIQPARARRRLGDHPPGFDLEVRRAALFHLLDQQQLKGGVSGLEGHPPALQHLDPLGDPGDQIPVAGQVKAQLAALELDGGAAGHVGDQQPHVVAD
jgi:hypothetical protein